MARPRNNPQEDVSATERVSAPVTVQQPAPRRLSVERKGDSTVPMAIKMPDIRGGVCEFCGVLDPKVDSMYQYKICPHFRGLEARCSYCPASKDPEDVVYHSNLLVYEYPAGSGTLVMLCGSYECTRRHENRFKVNS